MPINGGSSFRKCVWSMEKKKLSLPKQIGIALLLGILAGYAFYMLGIPEFTTNYLKPFGTIFVNLLKFIVVPVVLLSMIDGIISMGDMKKVGSVGWKTVAYFLVTTAAASAGEKGKLAKDLVSTLYAVIERVMAFIIALSPIGVFTMMAWVVATQGPEILGSLAVVLGCAYLGYIVHAVLCYSFSAKAFAGISPFTFFKKASPAMIFAFTSTSSAATIPLSKECADELGAEGDVSSFVIPLGATINMDGTAIYQCVATIFLATCCGMTLTLGQMVTIVVTATLASIGTAGTPGAGMIMLAMVLEAMNIPVDMIMIIYGIDRLFDMGRTCLNITGDISCACCVTKWESKKAAQTAK